MKKTIHIKKFVKKHVITIWLVIATVAFCGIFAYAKFNEGQNYTKRVVSTGTNDKVLFTSNLLNTSNSGHPKAVTKGYSSDSYYDINIYNYDKNKVSSYYSGTINYTLSAMLVKPDASSTVYDTTVSADLNALKNVLVETHIDNTDPDNPITTYTYHKIYIYRLIDGTPEDTPIVASYNVENCQSAWQAANFVKIEIELKSKNDDYEASLDIFDYIQESTFTIFNGEIDSDDIITTGTTTNKLVYIIDKADLEQFYNDKVYRIPIDFNVYSGSGSSNNFESSNRQYSNYGIFLKVSMLQASNSPSAVSGTEPEYNNNNYVKYTNARIYLEKVNPNKSA